MRLREWIPASSWRNAPYRGTSPIRKGPPPRTTRSQEAYLLCRVLGGICFLSAWSSLCDAEWREARTRNRVPAPLQGYLAHKKTTTPLGP